RFISFHSTRTILSFHFPQLCRSEVKIGFHFEGFDLKLKLKVLQMKFEFQFEGFGLKLKIKVIAGVSERFTEVITSSCSETRRKEELQIRIVCFVWNSVNRMASRLLLSRNKLHISSPGLKISTTRRYQDSFKKLRITCVVEVKGSRFVCGPCSSELVEELLRRKEVKEAAEKELQEFAQILKSANAMPNSSKPGKEFWTFEEKSRQKIEALEAYAIDVLVEKMGLLEGLDRSSSAFDVLSCK
ncbi:hypothetical protein C5167_041687, partial [Papaver somniferum]